MGTGVNGAVSASQENGVKSDNRKQQTRVLYGRQPAESEAEAHGGGADDGDGADTAGQSAELSESEDIEAEFEKLIKGKYRDQYNARVSSTVQSRLKASKGVQDSFNNLSPALEMLAERYKIDVNDTKKLSDAILHDEAFYADEAIEKGKTAAELRDAHNDKLKIKELERRVARNEAEKKSQAQYQAWMSQANDARKIYPSLDLNAECKNERFVNLLKAGETVLDAYEAVHKHDIIPAAMSKAAEAAEKRTAAKVAANASRPSESGMGNNATTIVKNDVTALKKDDFREIRRRVAAGEKISF